jgi:hypothetical protein
MQPRSTSKFAVLGANALLGLMFAALSVLADDAPQPKRVPVDVGPAALAGFGELDRDRDGHLAREEVPASLDLSRTYANYDLDGDGKLSRAEFDKYKQWKETLARMQGADAAKKR